MALTEQIELLIQRLLALSKEDKVNWQETAIEQKFLAAVSKYVVTIEEATWNGLHYTLEVSDQTGKVLEAVTVTPDLKIDSRSFDELSELHTLARRRALKVDAALSDLLSDLAEIR
ncbi:MAG: hypothetical protein ABIR70_23985 [Bryobacteraceae bacterium]